MINLTREVRFSLSSDAIEYPISNSWGGWPVASGVGPSMVLQCSLTGVIEPVSGYLCNISLVDKALRERVITPWCGRFAAIRESGEGKDSTFESLVRFAYEQVRDQFPQHCTVSRLRLCVTPTLHYTLNSKDLDMIQLTQQFEFSASHRLHNPDLSDEQNRQLFGKCNNPHGHGHNYVVMVTIQGTVDPETGMLIALDRFESLVKEQVIDRMDHRNLNVEIAEFSDLNPSVENIAMVVWNLLNEPLQSMSGSACLSRIRIYETPKTWADYCGD